MHCKEKHINRNPTFNTVLNLLRTLDWMIISPNYVKNRSDPLGVIKTGTISSSTVPLRTVKNKRYHKDIQNCSLARGD